MLCRFPGHGLAEEPNLAGKGIGLNDQTALLHLAADASFELNAAVGQTPDDISVLSQKPMQSGCGLPSNPRQALVLASVEAKAMQKKVGHLTLLERTSFLTVLIPL